MTAPAPGAEERDRVGPYRLLKAIGAGGSARIDLARIDRSYGFQRHVVVKRPLEHLRDDPRAAASLQREARIGGLVRHPNLVAVLDAGTHDGYIYLVLEYVHGGSLRALMQDPVAGRVRACPAPVAIAIALDVARALHHAHELADEHGTPLGLVHRDVSPGNVLLALDGAVKLADFGIAKETRVQTLSGSMHGTVTYMAPEQCRGHAFDRRADVFSLGVILYELITETRLFWADNDVASLHRVLSGNVPRPRKVRPQIAAALEDIIMTAVAHDPEKRFASARAFAEALETHAEDTGAIVSARGIATWAEELLGPRGVPWLAAPAADLSARSRALAAAPPDAASLGPAPREEGSLVALIEATPDEPPPEAFGPSDGNAVDDETDRRRPMTLPGTRRRRRIVLGAVIATGLAAGSVATAIVMQRTAPDQVTGQVTSRPAPPDDDPPPVTMPVTIVPDAAIDEAAADDEADAEPAEPAPAPTITEVATDEAAPAPHAKKRTKKPKKKPRTEAAPPVADKPPAAEAAPAKPEPPPKPEPAQTGSGARAPVRWDPGQMMPSDKRAGSGTKP